MSSMRNAFRGVVARASGPASALRIMLLCTAVVAGGILRQPSLTLDARPQTAPVAEAQKPSTLQVVTDRTTYNVGEQVWLRILPPSPQALQALDSYRFTLRYAGDEKALLEGVALHNDERGAAPPNAAYHLLWQAPLTARTGRYEIDLRVEDPASHQVLQEVPRATSFTVHRQVVEVSAEVGQPFYTSGDIIACNIRVENLGAAPLQGLRVEFSERYWPWIVQQTERVGTGIKTLRTDIDLKPHQRLEFGSPCADAPKVDQPAIKQYAAVVWDHNRQDVLAVNITPLVFINPPGVRAPRPYPAQFVYPSLKAVNTSNYRHFHPEAFGAEAIQFETDHTMFAPDTDAKVRFTLVNPTDAPWKQVSVPVRLVDPEGKVVAEHKLSERVDLNPHAPPLKQEVSFQITPGARGLYHVRLEITDEAGNAVAGNELELGVNPLPASVLVFCAHEDDDGTQMGFIRALVENDVPFHMVYFTSGDAGSCDRYFQHTCGPADALDFGAIRMHEARAAMGHLGVPLENIIFLGLPDGGTGKIWYEHPRSADPYPAVLLASDHAPYEGLFRPNLPFARDAVLEATEAIIKQYQPEVVFTVHPPAEGHIDHIVNNYFVVKALQELLRLSAISPNLELRVDKIFNPKEHPATPYHYEAHKFYVSGEVMARAQEAEWFYQSQGGNRGEGNLRTWDKLQRSEDYRKVLDWKDHEGWNDKE